jgi:Ca2+-binding RTX toxin-like protein
LTAIVSAASPAVSPTLSAPAGREAVRGGETLTVGGIADPQATLVRAELRFLDAAGEPLRDPANSTWSVRVDGGAISGTASVPSICPDESTAQDCLQRARDGRVVLAVTVDKGGESLTGISNALPIDMIDPYILRTSLVAPDQIEVTFSEPVELADGSSESELDALGWTIDGTCQRGRPAIAVTGQGSARRLTLAVAEDEDATPQVTFCPLPNRPAYQDRADRNLGGAGRITIALDRIAPKIPVIGDVAGRTGSDIIANDPSPIVRVDGLRAGHFGQVYLESEDRASGFDRLEDTFLGEAKAGASGLVDVQVLQDLGPDGTYTLYGVARDNAKCTSSGSTICPNYSGADDQTYRLDTRPPFVQYTATEGPQVHVRFSEEVSGTDDPTQWTVTPGGPVTGVSGTGNERTLSVSDAPAEALVTWTRPASGAYADAAGNGLDSFEMKAADIIPPVITVRDPLSTTWTSEDVYRITGSVSKPGSLVEAFQGGTLAAGQQLGASETDFALDVALAHDQSSSFVLRATDALGNVNRSDTFLSSIIQDSTGPTVKVLAPAKDDFLAGGTSFSIRWDAADANFGPGPISIFFSPGGAPWEPVAANEPNDGEFSWVVPGTSLEDGQIRIVAEDRVGLTAEAVSELFSIDAEPPVFAALTEDAHHVAVLFTEPVTGSIAADEWSIDGIPAAAARTQPLTEGMKAGGLVLETVQEIGRNALPLIGYEPRELPGREPFRDHAGNRIPSGASEVAADDGIAPLIPSIDRIAGEPADGATSEDTTPEVEIGNVDQDDIVNVFVESDGQAGLSDADRLVGTAVAGPSGAKVTTEELGGDGDYTLYAAARDASGNDSPSAGSALYKLRTGVLPPAPVIEQVAGRPADAPVTANDPSPDVKVGSLAAGAAAEVYVESNGDGRYSPGDRLLGEAVADESGALVQTSDLGSDGQYRLYAVTRAANGRRSAGADDATYVLDATSPKFAARVADASHVAVTFAEPVSGAINELEWRIDGLPASATQPPRMAENVTALELETMEGQTLAPTQSPVVSYNPVAGETTSPAPAELLDAAGNWIRTKTVHAAALGTGSTGGQTGGGGEEPGQQPGQAPAEGSESPGEVLCTITGTIGDDVLVGTEGDDVFCPMAGADKIIARGGDDIVLSGTGPKTILGGAGDDLLRGGSGNDRLNGGAGNDRLYGLDGADLLSGRGGRDRLFGGADRDLLNGGSATDACTGGGGRDTVLHCERGKAR